MFLVVAPPPPSPALRCAGRAKFRRVRDKTRQDQDQDQDKQVQDEKKKVSTSPLGRFHSVTGWRNTTTTRGLGELGMQTSTESVFLSRGSGDEGGGGGTWKGSASISLVLVNTAMLNVMSCPAMPPPLQPNDGGERARHDLSGCDWQVLPFSLLPFLLLFVFFMPCCLPQAL